MRLQDRIAQHGVGRFFRSMQAAAIGAVAAFGLGAAAHAADPAGVTYTAADADGGQLLPGDTVTFTFNVLNIPGTLDYSGGAVSLDVDAIWPGATVASSFRNFACTSGVLAEAATIAISDLASASFNCGFSFDVVVPLGTPAATYTFTPSNFTGDDNTNTTTFDIAIPTFDLTVESDTVAPTPTLAGPAGPVNAPFDVRVQFDERVNGFVIGDIVATNATVSLPDPGEGDPIISALLRVTPTGSSGDTITIDLPAAAAQDEAGNDSVAATQYSVLIGSNPIDLVDFSMEFIDDPIDAGDSATLRYTISNASGEDLSSGFFTHNVGVIFTGTVAVGPLPSTPCGAGSVLTGTSFLIATGINLVDGDSCSFDVTIDTPAGIGEGANPTTTSSLSYSLATSGAQTDDPTGTSLLISGAEESGGVLGFSKTFTDDPVDAGDTVTLEFSIFGGSFTTTDIAFTDDLDAVLSGLAATGLPATDVCGVGSTLSGASTIALTGGNLGVDETCTFSVTLSVPGAAASGDYANATSTLTATRSDTGATTVDPATDTLTVVGDAAPTVTISGPAGPVGDGLGFTAEFRFSEPVTGFELGDIVVTNGAASDFVANSTTEYEATITPAAVGTTDVDVGAGVAIDGNALGNLAATTYSVVVVTPEPEIEVSIFSDITNGDTTPDASDGTFFGAADVAVGNVRRSVTISNTGTGDLTLGGISLGGAHGADWDPGIFPGTIAPGDSAVLSFNFDPSALGLREATVSITNNDADEAPFTFAISGEGASAPEINVTDDSGAIDIFDGDVSPAVADGTDFGDADVSGAGVTTTFIIENLGSADLTLGSPAVTVSGDSFSVASQPTGPISAAGTSSFSIMFDPLEAGVQTGTVTIESNDADEDPYTFAVQGTGLDAVAPSGYSVAFDTDPYTVLNNTTASFTISDGEPQADFTYSITSSGGGTAVAGSGTIPIPETPGTTPELQITGLDLSGLNDGTLTVTVALTDPSGNTGVDATDTATLSTAIPDFSKAFSPSTVIVGGESTLTFTIDNSAVAVSATSLDFTDNLPAGMVVASPSNAATTCTGGTLTAVAGSGVISYTGASVGAGASCTVSVDVDTTTNGSLVNTSGDLTHNLGNSGTSTDTLTVNQPTISVDDPSVLEGDTGTASLDFTVSLSAASSQTVTVDYATSDGTAAAGDDYTAASGTVTFTPGSTSETVSVDVNGDFAVESDETVTLTLSSPTNASIADATGSGTITNDDFDSTPPTVTSILRDTPTAENTNADSVVFEVIFSENVLNVGAADFTVSGPTGASIGVTGSGDTYDVTISGGDMAGLNAVVDLGFAGGQDITDEATNALANTTPGTEETFTLDNTAPTPVISSLASDPVSGAFDVTIDFGETVSGFVVGDIAVGGGSAGAFSDDGAGAFSATITPSGDGTVTVDVSASVATDQAGNANNAATQFSIENDETPPTVTISSSSSDPVSGAFSVDIDFSEDVTGFVVGDITVGNGSASALTGSGGNYSATITPAADGTVTVDVAAAVAQDDAGNDNTAATQFSIESDSTMPSVTISTASSDPVSGPFNVTILFDEPVTGFTSSEVTVGNGAVTRFTLVNPAEYTAEITPAADGPVTVDVAAGVAQDSAGNDNAAATQFTIENDETRPDVTLSTTAGDPTSGAFTLDVVFTEDVTGLADGDFTVVNGAASGTAGSGDTYTVTITPAADGTVTVNLLGGAAQDAAGNISTSATEFSIENDETAPTVAITSDAGGDPVSGTFTVTATFDETVDGFDISDFAVGNGAASAFTAAASPSGGINASGTVFTALITPTADGLVTVDIAAGAAQDAAGNDNVAATQFSVTADGTAPTVTSVTPSDALLQRGDEGSPFSLAVLFAEEMDTSLSPALAFNEDLSGTLSLLGGGWSGDGLTYTAIYDVADNRDFFEDLDVTVSNGQDLAGNALVDQQLDDVFSIDMAEGDLRVDIVTLGGDPAVAVEVDSDVDGVIFDGTIVRFGDFAPGAGTVTVTAITPADFVLDSLVCVDPDNGSTVDAVNGIATVDLDNRESITCTFTYQGQGDITITGVANDAPGNFDFTGDLGAFTIAATAGGTSQLFADQNAGEYSVSLPETDGYEFEGLVCTGDTDGGGSVSGNTATIDLDPGESIECTFEQTAVPNLVVDPTLTVDLNLPTNITNPADVNVDVPLTNSGSVDLDFTAAVDVPWITIDPTSGTVAPGQTININVALNNGIDALDAGTYNALLTITRLATAPSGGVSGSNGTSGQQVVQIPITLVLAPRRGTVQIVATTGPTAAGEATFTYASTIAAFDGLSLTTSGQTASSSAEDLLRGAYTVTQSLPDGWRVDSVTCAGDADGGSTVDLSTGTLTIDLDADEALVCTFANVRDEAAVILATQRAIRNFMVRRADRIIESQPDLTRRMLAYESPQASGFSADATEGRWTMRLNTSLHSLSDRMRDEGEEAEERKFDIWLSAEFASISDDRAGDAAESDFGILHVGGDIMVREGLMIGVMASRDWMSETSNDIATHLGALRGAEVEGEGWLAGPYAVFELGEGAVVDVRALYGGSTNDVNPLGLYTDEFETDRWMIQANITGEWRNGPWRVRPTAGLTHYDETQNAYTDSLGILIPSQDIAIGRVNFGPEFAYRNEMGRGGYWEPSLKLNGLWDYDPAQLMDENGALVGTATFRADAQLGFTAEFSNGARFEARVGVSGLGENDFEAQSGGFRFRFPM